MTEPEEPTFSLIVLSFTKAEGDAGLIRALCEAFKFGPEDARAIVQGLPLRVKRGADRATTRHLAGQLLGMGAELCITNEQTGVEKLYYPGSGYSDDDAPTSRDSNPSARKRAETGPTSRRSADPGASMRDALRQARQRAQGEGGAPVSIRPSDGAPVSIRPSDDAPASISIPPPISAPPASGPESISQPPPIELSPSTPPGPRPAARRRADREAEEVATAARRRRMLRVGLALAAVIVLGGAGFVASSFGPTSLTVEVAGRVWKAAWPKGAIEGESSSTSLLTELGAARMIIRSANSGGPLKTCVLGHLAFAAPPKLEGTAIELVMQHAVDELAPGGKLAAGEAVRHGKASGRQARFSGAGGGGPFGKVRALQMANGDIALLVIVGNAEGAADGPEATAWLESFSGGE